MKTRVNSKEVFDAMMLVKNIATNSKHLPILTHCLVEADGGTTTITMTDLEVSVRLSFNSQTIESGVCTLPVKEFMNTLRGKTGLVTLTSETKEDPNFPAKDSCNRCPQFVYKTTLTFDSGLSASWSGVAPSDFPVWQDVADITTTEVAAAELVNCINRVSFAAFNADSGFNLEGVLIEKNENQTRFVATDGHRLALIDSDIQIPIFDKLIAPKSGLLLLGKFLTKNKGNIQVGFDRKNMVVYSGDNIMTIRLIEGDYPDYLRVIPTDSPAKEVVVDRGALLIAMNELKPMTSDRYQGVNIQLNGSILISANNPDKGEMSMTVDCNSTHGHEIVDLIMNRVYMVDALANSKSSEITITYYKEGAPLQFMAPDHWSIVMPMRS